MHKPELANANQALQTELTQCKQVASVLRSELDRLTAILNTVNALIVVLDREGYIVRFNRACEQTTGYSFNEVSNQPFWDLFRPQDESESVKTVLRNLQVDQLAIAHENDWITKDGIRRRIAWFYAPLLDSSGALKYVIGTGVDITEFKQTSKALSSMLEELTVADEELRLQNEELAHAREAVERERQRYQELFESAPDSYLVTSPEGLIQEANRAAGTMLGLLPTFLVGKPIANFILKEERQAFRLKLLQLAQIDRLQDWTVRLQPRGGTPLDAALTVAAVRDGDGKLIALRWLLRDITSRKQAEEALRTLHEELESRVQERTTELAKANVALQAEVTERKRAQQVSLGQTEALVKTLTVLAAEPVLDNFLGYVLQAIAEQLGESSGGIWLYDEEYDTTILHIDYESGQIRRGAQISRPGASRQNVLRQWDADYMQLLREKKVLIQYIQDLPETPATAQSRAYNEKRGIETILVVCLFFGETFLGNITLRSTRRRDYKPEELELACVLAYQASLAIQLTRLAEQAQQSAVLEERNRIAREIHDTLAQVLTGIVVQLQAAEDVHTTDPSDRQAHIAAARLLAKQGLTEARRSVRALRPQALENTDLGGVLTNLIEQIATGTGIQAVCHVRGTPYLLPPDVESNLLRIGQEAFTNTLKHAGASEIQIELIYKPGQVRLRVQDNGQGFDPDLPPTEGYGLLSMRERAHSIGAELTITSQPGHGTEVVVVVPILAPDQRSSS